MAAERQTTIARKVSCAGVGVHSGARECAHIFDGSLPPLSDHAVLAEQVAAHRALAVSGTSGKSTVTAMVYEVLEAAKRSPSVAPRMAAASAS